LRRAIEHATHLLPAQGPITVFIHHNTLHAFEDLPFEKAVVRGARTFGCQPFLTEERYRSELRKGRISPGDLSAVLRDELGGGADAKIVPGGTRLQLRMAMLEHPLRSAPAAELRWFVAESGALARCREDVAAELRQHLLRETRHWIMRDVRPASAHSTGTYPAARERRTQAALTSLLEQFAAGSIERWTESAWESFALQALWRVSRAGVHATAAAASQASHQVRPRDALLAATGEDSDLLVHTPLIRFCAAFLDQGFAPWPLAHRDRGFLAAFNALYRGPAGPPQAWMRGLSAELRRLELEQIAPLTSIQESLGLLGVGDDERDEFIAATLLALRGWAGMIQQMEVRADRAAHGAPPGSVVEYLAVRLILERLALRYLAKETLGFDGPLAKLRHAARAQVATRGAASLEQRAFLVFELAQLLGWTPQQLYRLSSQDWRTLIAEIESFPSIERRRVFHLAYERRYRVQTLDALSIRAGREPISVPRPRFQVICCLDEREESFRRHLEEVDPDIETFSTAGFFNVAMYYRGAADAHYVPLCPVVIRPQHYVREDAIADLEEIHQRRSRTRRILGSASHQVHVRSRTFAGGALLTGLFGPLASIPLVARILFPRLTARIRRQFGRLVQPPPLTSLQLERRGDTPGPAEGELGFTLSEMAGIVERVLRDIGLTTRWSPLVIVAGHGSSSLNNPHESAHDCGACGGGRGGPNARAFARMANDPRVREALAKAGLSVPPQTVFVGAYHNTCDESVTYFDLDRLPGSHQLLLDEARRLVDVARQRNAHERCRRFESAPLDLSPEAALRHVEARAEDLAQTRPEYGHATNAVAIVGRRSRTRGLYLDRRTFLTSYDPTQDDAERTILVRILQAVVPVCAGINLEYYFSYVDPAGFGCGTKLPHNITSLLGVMDGAASDLRTGLPWQMVEIHDPVRLLMIVETTPESMLAIIERYPAIGGLCRNGWLQLATLSPDDDQIHLFHRGQFERYEPQTAELPQVDSSSDWYRGWREHLGYALISAGRNRQSARGPAS
jgi:uncharacterized protein YbcC (UPF0753/DUF2309 family)